MRNALTIVCVALVSVLSFLFSQHIAAADDQSALAELRARLVQLESEQLIIETQLRAEGLTAQAEAVLWNKHTKIIHELTNTLIQIEKLEKECAARIAKLTKDYLNIDALFARAKAKYFRSIANTFHQKVDALGDIVTVAEMQRLRREMLVLEQRRTAILESLKKELELQQLTVEQLCEQCDADGKKILRQIEANDARWAEQLTNEAKNLKAETEIQQALKEEYRQFLRQVAHANKAAQASSAAAQQAAKASCLEKGIVEPLCPVRATITPHDLARQTSQDLLADLERFSHPRVLQYNPHNVMLIKKELERGRAMLERQLAGLNRAAYASDEEFQRAFSDIQREINEINDGLNSQQVKDALKRCAPSTPCPAPLTAEKAAELAAAKKAAAEARARFFEKAADGIRTGKANAFAEFNKELAPYRAAMQAADERLAAALAMEQNAARQAAIAARAYEIETRLLGGAAARGIARTVGRSVLGSLLRGASVIIAAGTSIPALLAWEVRDAIEAYVARKAELEDAVAAGLAMNSMRIYAENIVRKIIVYWKDYLDALDAENAVKLCGASPRGAAQTSSDKILDQLFTYAGQLEAYDAAYKITAIFKFAKEASAFVSPEALNSLLRTMSYDGVTEEWRVPAPWLGDRDILEENKRRDSVGNYYYVFRIAAIPGGRQAVKNILDAVDEKIYLTLFAGGGGSMLAINEYVNNVVVPATLLGIPGCLERTCVAPAPPTSGGSCLPWCGPEGGKIDCAPGFSCYTGEGDIVEACHDPESTASARAQAQAQGRTLTERPRPAACGGNDNISQAPFAAARTGVTRFNHPILSDSVSAGNLLRALLKHAYLK